MTALSAAELASYEEDGFVTIDTPLSSAALAAAEGAFDRLLGAASAKNSDRGAYQAGGGGADMNKDTNVFEQEHHCFNSKVASPCHEDADFISTIANPFFEDVAKQVLRTDEVEFIEVFPLDRPPTPHLQGGWPGWREVWAQRVA